MSVKQVVIDENVCVTCGVCVAMIDDVFKYSDDYSKVVVKEFNPKSVSDADIDEVINACPVDAISKVND